jgi:hypothetical protein
VRVPEWILAALVQKRREAPAPGGTIRREWVGQAVRRLLEAPGQFGERAGRPASDLSGLQGVAEAILRGAECYDEQLMAAEGAAKGRAWLQQYMDDNVVYAATCAGVRGAAEALLQA